LVNPSSPTLSRWDSDQIGPWTRWLGDLEARVMVVGQDWGSRTLFRKQRGIDIASNATNTRLAELLALVGVSVSNAGAATNASGVFLTNAVLCLKDGNSQSTVAAEWFARCGQSFLRPQIELVRPRVVVTLGRMAYESVMASFALPIRSLREAVESPGVQLPTGSTCVPVYHCGRRVRNTHRSDREQERDWQRVAEALASESARVCRRLHIVRGWSHAETFPIFA
jgi:uracil-DNA glycosylase family 4